MLPLFPKPAVHGRLLVHFLNILIPGKVPPEPDQNNAHDQHQHATHQGCKLDGIHIHSQQGHGIVTGDGTDIGTGDHTQERKHVAADGMKRNVIKLI